MSVVPSVKIYLFWQKAMGKKQKVNLSAFGQKAFSTIIRDDVLVDDIRCVEVE
jgi:hypothetical protein